MTLASCTAASAASRPLFDGPGGGFVQRVGRQDAERHRHARGLRRHGDRMRDRRRQVVEVRGLAPNDAAEANHRIERPRFRGAAGRERNLERARNLDYRDRAGTARPRSARPRIPKRSEGAVAQRSGNRPVVSGHDDADPQARTRSASWKGGNNQAASRG